MNGGAGRWGSLLLFVYGCGNSARDFAPADRGNAGGGNAGASATTGGTGGSGDIAGTAGKRATVTGGATGHAGEGDVGDAGQPSSGGSDGSAGSGTTGGSGPSAGSSNTAGASAGGGITSSGGSPPTAGTGNAGAPTVVAVQLSQAHQTIDGFGINDALSGDAWTTAIADHLFTTTGDGLGLSVLRVVMTATGGVLTAGGQTTDMTLAKERGAKLIGTAWSPPANCKNNNSQNDGGHLLASCYQTWSETIAKFASDNGLYAMSIAGQPDFASCGTLEPCNGNFPSTVYTAKELVAFTKVAAPKLKAKNVKAIVGEASEWIHIWSNASATGSEPSNKNSSDPLKCGFPPSSAACDGGDGYDYGHWLAKDTAAWDAVDILGVQEYDTQRAEPWPPDVSVRKPVWQTEMAGIKWWPEQGTGNGASLMGSKTIENGVAVAGWIHSALVVGDASAWLWGAYKSLYNDDNEGLINKNGEDTKRHYALGNFSKFVRPGYVRVGITGPIPSEVLLSGFKGVDGTVVVVAINKATTAVSVPITIAGGTAPALMTPWVTSATMNLQSQSAIAVAGGKFTAALGAMSITTFVGK